MCLFWLFWDGREESKEAKARRPARRETRLRKADDLDAHHSLISVEPEGSSPDEPVWRS